MTLLAWGTIIIMISKPVYDRQSSIIDLDEVRDNHVLIVGCGAIGSFAAISLAKMGLTNFTVCDFDTVEAHNLPNQFFTLKNIGRYKSATVKKSMVDFNPDAKVTSYIIRFSKVMVENRQIVVSCVDSMKTRKEIFDACKNSNVQLFIDARMGGLQAQLYTVDMTNKIVVDNYERSLFADDESQETNCTERSIIFTVLGISSLICSQVVKALNDQPLKNYLVLDYTVPQLMG